MRVITGSARGFGLKSPRNPNLRPTPARAKEAIFSSLAEFIPQTHVLELFAGSGAFSIECLSRGAESATLVETNPSTLRVIQTNLQKTHLEDKARVLKLDVRQALKLLQREGSRFHLVFADPPYHETIPDREDQGPAQNGKISWSDFLLRSPDLPLLLEDRGILLLEYFKKHPPAPSPHFQLRREFKFGDTVIALYGSLPK